MLKKYLTLIALLSTTFGYAQVHTHYVKPIQTDATYSASEDSSAISRNTGTQLNKLFLFIGGTGSSSSSAYNALRLHSANLGFDFINLSYPNSVAAASLKNDSDSLAFNKYRQEICFGTPGSDAVSVDSLNSIYSRTLKLLHYLDTTYPSENWGQYLATASSINWYKVIVGGHSQGAGHAAYLAKQFGVDRAIMFSGPNDYSDHFSNSANWLRQSGVTPISKQFAYLSLNDEVVDFSKQFTNLSGLGVLTNGDSTHVDLITTPFNNSSFLYTTQPPGIVILNHSSPVKLSSKNSEVWTYMLTSTITTNINSGLSSTNLSAYPNPVSTKLYISSSEQLNGKAIIRNKIGHIIMNQNVTNQKELEIDLSRYPSGVYFITINNSTFRIIKQP